jgi:transcription-repair coupling factor (superfamily II helicase)
VLALHHDVSSAIQEFWRDAQSRYKLLGGDADRPLLPPAQIFVPAEEFYLRAKAHPRVDLAAGVSDEPGAEDESQPDLVRAAALPPLAVDRRAQDPLAALKSFLGSSGLKVLLAAESPGRRETMLTYLAEYGVQPTPCAGFAAFLASPERLQLAVAPLANGFALAAEGWCVVTEAELYAGTVRRRGRSGKTTSVEGMLRDLSELKIGDPVVHVQHGIGRYAGLVRLDLGQGRSGEMSEFLQLEYDGGDKLYVPVSQLAVISRYSGAQPEVAPLHKLGSGQWDKARARAAKQVRDTAAELLALYAKRAAREGHAFSVRQHDIEAFADGFGFEETPDQAAAIEAVVQDMASGKPMDRLICGDVGFGKTEVALRAAFVAVADGQQVALLCPTTLLVEQHFQTFSDRFADWPVRIAELSRFRSAKQSAEVLQKLAAGELDIVIGTHKLLAREVKFARLGLVVIDEEHRFGVAQKERIRQLTTTVDVLAMTATPIPRTLNLSLAGARDMSVIETPPRDRLPVHTEILELDEEVVTDAILREVDRGGQAFFVHNRVETIHNAALRLQKLVPQVRVAVAHGQMHERELERVMLEFLDRRWDVLVSTMIIESGIDMPSVNTLIVDRADTLGLAQLYQLRGRVGRSAHRAYAYLLVPSRRVLTEEAETRLRVIEELDELGVGFKIALKDMEIRGAGNLLGPEQHGFILGLGFDLYVKLLEEAVAALKGAAAEVKPEPRLLTDWSAFLPDDYVPDEHEKLNLYRRLADTRTTDELDDLTLEMLDRFGQLPPPAVALFELRGLRLLAAAGEVESLRVFQDVTELALRRPLKPAEIRTVVGMLALQVEFFTGREFGLRVRGQDLVLLNRTRELLQALAVAVAPAAAPAGPGA